MAYSTDILDTRVTILNRTASTETALGKKSGTYQEVRTIWCSWKFTKGMKAMHEGALDAYDTIMMRCRFHGLTPSTPADERHLRITRDSRIRHEGRDYQITSLNADRHANEMQILLQEVK